MEGVFKRGYAHGPGKLFYQDGSRWQKGEGEGGGGQEGVEGGEEGASGWGRGTENTFVKLSHFLQRFLCWFNCLWILI